MPQTGSFAAAGVGAPCVGAPCVDPSPKSGSPAPMLVNRTLPPPTLSTGAATVIDPEKVALLPVATDGSVEDYVVPTFDGGSREFSESSVRRYVARGVISMPISSSTAAQ